MSSAPSRRRGGRGGAEKTCVGVPAVADMTSWARSVGDEAPQLCRVAEGGTPPTAQPVGACTSSALARARLPQRRRAEPSLRSSRRSAPPTRAMTGSSSTTNTSDFTIWATSQPMAVAVSSAVRVPCGNVGPRRRARVAAAARATCSSLLMASIPTFPPPSLRPRAGERPARRLPLLDLYAVRGQRPLSGRRTAVPIRNPRPGSRCFWTPVNVGSDVVVRDDHVRRERRRAVSHRPGRSRP